MAAHAVVPASLDVPLTQQTAPVLEHRCLYTSDRHKKVKKWHDGRLKLHTFNKKILVWDERSHLIGETYWREDFEFGEGAELVLERNGTLVDVQDLVGRTETDLSDLVGKRVKERDERATKIAHGTPARHPSTNHGGMVDLGAKSLNAMLTPSGHHGRALMPTISPFEQKRQDAENLRPAKRRKQDSPTGKSGYAQSLTGTQISLKSTYTRPRGTAPLRHEPLKISVRQAPAATIDLTEDGNDTERINRERPHKLQKLSRLSPKAKSGYASNLTGASLSLSRPGPSTQRPKQVRAKPISPMRRKPPTDLSSSLAVNQESPNVEMTEERLKKAARKPTRSRSSSPLVEYCSSDGQVAEVKSKPRAQQMVSKKRPHTSLDISSSSAVDEEVTPTPKRNFSEALSNQDSRTVSKRKNDRASLSHSSVPRSESPNNIVSEYSSLESAPDRPIPGLRIKSRPPRKMMMFLDRSSSRSSAESSISRRPVQKPPDTPEILEPSQATKQLSEFCKKQKEAVEARFNRKRTIAISDDNSSLPDVTSPKSPVVTHPKPILPTTILQEPISSPCDASAQILGKGKAHEILNEFSKDVGVVDSQLSMFDDGIDHQTIDRLLTRKTSPVSKELADAAPSEEQKTSSETSAKAIAATEDQDAEPAAHITTSSPANVASMHEKITEQADKESLLGSKDESHRSTLGVKFGEAEVKAINLPDSRLLTELPTDDAGAMESLTEVDGVEAEIGIDEAVSSRQTSGSKAHSLLEDSPPEPARVSPHASNTMSNHDSVSSRIKELERELELAREREAQYKAERQANINAQQITERATSDSKIQSATSAASVNPGDVASSLTSAQVKQSESQPHPVSQVRNAAPKARLVNPATRGKPLHSVAKDTVEFLRDNGNLTVAGEVTVNNAFFRDNGNPIVAGEPSVNMPPPPIWKRMGFQRPQVTESGIPPQTGRGAAKVDTSSGPWSRESFDLFGDCKWQPPNRLAAGLPETTTG